jgi:hypothetical protein
MNCCVNVVLRLKAPTAVLYLVCAENQHYSGEEIRSGLLTGWRTRSGQAQVVPGRRSCHSATLGAHKKALPDQERLGDLFNGFALFANRNSKRRQSDRSATEPAAHRIEYGAVQPVQAKFVHLVKL